MGFLRRRLRRPAAQQERPGEQRLQQPVRVQRNHPDENGFGRRQLLLLPTGEIMIDGTKVYKGTGTYQQAVAPVLFKPG